MDRKRTKALFRFERAWQRQRSMTLRINKAEPGEQAQVINESACQNGGYSRRAGDVLPHSSWKSCRHGSVLQFTPDLEIPLGTIFFVFPLLSFSFSWNQHTTSYRASTTTTASIRGPHIDPVLARRMSHFTGQCTPFSGPELY
jgi:hypothetical protein